MHTCDLIVEFGLYGIEFQKGGFSPPPPLEKIDVFLLQLHRDPSQKFANVKGGQKGLLPQQTNTNSAWMVFQFPKDSIHIELCIN
jgi:hypothetical protein